MKNVIWILFLFFLICNGAFAEEVVVKKSSPCAFNVEDLMRALKFMEKGDTDQIELLTMKGKIFATTQNTKAEYLDSSPRGAYWRVQLLEGKNPFIVWVHSASILKSSPKSKEMKK